MATDATNPCLDFALDRFRDPAVKDAFGKLQRFANHFNRPYIDGRSTLDPDFFEGGLAGPQIEALRQNFEDVLGDNVRDIVNQRLAAEEIDIAGEAPWIVVEAGVVKHRGMGEVAIRWEHWGTNDSPPPAKRRDGAPVTYIDVADWGHVKKVGFSGFTNFMLGSGTGTGSGSAATGHLTGFVTSYVWSPFMSGHVVFLTGSLFPKVIPDYISAYLSGHQWTGDPWIDVSNAIRRIRHSGPWTGFSSYAAPAGQSIREIWHDLRHHIVSAAFVSGPSGYSGWSGWSGPVGPAGPAGPAGPTGSGASAAVLAGGDEWIAVDGSHPNWTIRHSGPGAAMGGAEAPSGKAIGAIYWDDRHHIVSASYVDLPTP